MSKTATSHWDFGGRFPKEQTRRALSVTELTAQIKRLLEAQIGALWISGEIINFHAQCSGPNYFTLKKPART